MNEPYEMTEEEELRVRLHEPLSQFDRALKEASTESRFYSNSETVVLDALRKNSEVHACEIIHLDAQGATLPTIDSLHPRDQERYLKTLFAFVGERHRVHCEPLSELYDAPEDRSRMVFMLAIPDKERNRILLVVGRENAWSDTVEKLATRVANVLANPLTKEDRDWLGSAEWWIDFLFHLAISDRQQHMPLVENPSAELLMQVIDSVGGRDHPSRLLGRRKELAKDYGFLPISPLWRAWMKRRHGALLENMGRELIGEGAP